MFARLQYAEMSLGCAQQRALSMLLRAPFALLISLISKFMPMQGAACCHMGGDDCHVVRCLTPKTHMCWDPEPCTLCLAHAWCCACRGLSWQQASHTAAPAAAAPACISPAAAFTYTTTTTKQTRPTRQRTRPSGAYLACLEQQQQQGV
jgi:hypothetical protein